MVFEDFVTRKVNGGKYYSDPIVVDGCIYKLVLYPAGWGEGDGTHISVGISRTKLECLNLDQSDVVCFTKQLLH